MFLVLTGTQASMDVNFTFPSTASTVTRDLLFDSAFYSVRKTPLGPNG